MKRIITFVPFAAAVLSLCIFSGCDSDDGSGNGGKPAPELAPLEGTPVRAEAGGGNYEIGYELSNPAADGVVSASSEAEWIENLREEEGRIAFEVLPNPTPESRSASVGVSYLWSGGELSFEATVVQEGQSDPVPEGDFGIDIRATTTSGITVRVVPADEETTYLVRAADRAQFEAVGAEEWVSGDIAYLMEEAFMAGLGVAEYVKRIGHRGASTVEVTGLTPDSEYSLYVFGLSVSDTPELLTEVVTEVFSTKAVEKIDCSFDLQLAVDGTNVRMSVVPSSDDFYYFSDLVSPDELLYYEGETIGDRLTAYVTEVMLYFLNSLNYQIDDIACRGAHTEDYKGFDPYTDYVAFAVAVDESGVAISEAAYEEFETGDRTLAEAEITVEYETFYDGTEVAELYPDYAGTRGMALVPAYATVNDAAVGYLIGSYQGDLTSPDTVSDDEIIEELKKNGMPGSSLFVVPYDEYTTILAVAYDADNVFGKVFRGGKLYKREDAAPAEAFEPMAGGARAEFSPFPYRDGRAVRTSRVEALGLNPERFRNGRCGRER